MSTLGRETEGLTAVRFVHFGRWCQFCTVNDSLLSVASVVSEIFLRSCIYDVTRLLTTVNMHALFSTVRITLKTELFHAQLRCNAPLIGEQLVALYKNLLRWFDRLT